MVVSLPKTQTGVQTPNNVTLKIHIFNLMDLLMVEERTYFADSHMLLMNDFAGVVKIL